MRKKLLFFVTEDWYFCSHRLPIARAAKVSGYDVVVVTRVGSHGEAIIAEGFKLIPLGMSRRSKNPFRELLALFEVIGIYWREKPDLVHHVALKPVLYGSVAARLTGCNKIINAVAGLGFVFSSNTLLARILRPAISFLFKLLFKNPNGFVIVQNPDDQKLLVSELSVEKERVVLIQGSGVDIDKFHVTNEPEGVVTVALVSRMLWDKGVGEFMAAAELLRKKGISFRSLLVGQPDNENPGSISEAQLVAWSKQEAVDWVGYVSDIPRVWSESHIAVLPSYYGEGVPKCLIEAAACSRAIVTTDMPGCREIVRDNENGLLVPARDAKSLAEALEKLIIDDRLRKKMGARGRQLVENEFSEEIVVKQTLALYDELMHG